MFGWLKSTARASARASMWLYNAEDPPFREGEEFVQHTAGGLLGPLPNQGRLLLTSQRLFFLPARARWLPHQFDFGSRVAIELRDIVATGRKPWVRGLYGGFPVRRCSSSGCEMGPPICSK
jgi:hypothetical protein